MHDNEGNGLWTDTENVDTLHEHNRVIGNTEGRNPHEISYDAVIRRNYVARNGLRNDWIDGARIMIAHSPNVRVCSKVVFRNGDGIGLRQSDRGSGPYGPHVVKHAYVHDNIITTCEEWTGAARRAMWTRPSMIAQPIRGQQISHRRSILEALDMGETRS
jgi:hypothetical protein